MRLLIVSDVHGEARQASKLRSVERDVTVVAGDLADCGGSVEEAHEVLEELASHGPPVVWVPGNCDTPVIVEAPPPRNTHLVHGNRVELLGLVFAGAGGGTYSPFSTPFEVSDEELGSTLEKALEGLEPGRPLIIVTHVPPAGSGLDRTRTGQYVGSTSVRGLVERVRPLLHACGHIHEAWGSTVVGSTLAVNPGPLAWGRYALVDLDVERKTVVARHAKL